jgi:hypothetical protein
METNQSQPDEMPGIPADDPERAKKVGRKDLSSDVERAEEARTQDESDDDGETELEEGTKGGGESEEA